ncbi:MAG: GAF domain-containing protein [Deltaproteobacteria bacterium]|nr:GAF domain-containing protein [Deltaproteobacteria bacterium]
MSRVTKLLLVEDNPGDAGLVIAALGEISTPDDEFQPVHAVRLGQAFEYAAEMSFDLILLDLSLPDAKGLDTVTRMTAAAPSVPIVVMTGIADQSVAIEAMRLGAQDYLVKGQVDEAMFGRTIRYAIERKKAEAEINRQLERQKILNDINRAIASTLDLESVMNILLEKVGQVFPQFGSMVHLLSPQRDVLEALAFRNVDAGSWQQTVPGENKGFNSITAHMKTPLVIRDAQNDPRSRRPEFLRRNGFVCYLGLPLIVKDQAVGVLALFAKKNDAFAEADIQFLNTLAGQAALAIHNSQLYQDIRAANERQAALYEVNLALTSSLDRRSILNTLLDKIDHLFPNFAVSIRLYNDGTRTWEGVACSNMDEADWRTTASKSGSGITQAVVDAGKPLVIPDTQLDPRTHNRDFQRRNGLVSYLGVPLIVKYEILGVIGFFSKVRHEFSPQEVELLSTLASQAAIAIHNAQLYDRLKRANETLEQTLEVKSILTGVMAHELKTPIQVIMGTASLLAEGMCGELNEEQRERIGKIEAGSEEMLQLIESSLDMARLEQGKMPLLVTEIRVGDLLAELESEFSELFAKKGLALEVNHPPLGPTIKSDRVKLKEILRNIIDNARKYTAHGKVSVEFAVKDAERVEFIVKDTGNGIKAELLPKIFELFYQVDPSQKEHASAGLGLNIVKRLVGAMSGEIDVTSEVGRGSAFRVTFPREISTHLPQ